MTGVADSAYLFPPFTLTEHQTPMANRRSTYFLGDDATASSTLRAIAAAACLESTTRSRELHTEPCKEWRAIQQSTAIRLQQCCWLVLRACHLRLHTTPRHALCRLT